MNEPRLTLSQSLDRLPPPWPDDSLSDIVRANAQPGAPKVVVLDDDPTGTQNLQIGRQVSDALVEIIRRLNQAPCFLIAKGGITSSDLATQGLGVRRAMVAGQLLPGVPVWRLGTEARFPSMPYVVFPGNVGDDQALADAVTRLSPLLARKLIVVRLRFPAFLVPGRFQFSIAPLMKTPIVPSPHSR
jgi:hypothetical protein